MENQHDMPAAKDDQDGDPWDPRYAGIYRERAMWTDIGDDAETISWTSGRLTEYLAALDELELAQEAKHICWRINLLAKRLRRRRREVAANNPTMTSDR